MANKIHGTKLWKVRIIGLNGIYLWITGPFKSVASKALRVARQDHDIKAPQIKSIKEYGTLDA